MIHGQLYLFYLKKASKWLFMARKVTKNDPMETGSSFKTRTGHSVEQSSCTLPQWASDCPPNAIGAEASRKSPKRRIADLFICENLHWWGSLDTMVPPCSSSLTRDRLFFVPVQENGKKGWDYAQHFLTPEQAIVHQMPSDRTIVNPSFLKTHSHLSNLFGSAFYYFLSKLKMW